MVMVVVVVVMVVLKLHATRNKPLCVLIANPKCPRSTSRLRAPWCCLVIVVIVVVSVVVVADAAACCFG